MRVAALVLATLPFCGAALATGATAARATELTVRGRVVDANGDPAAAVELRLLAAPTLFEQGLLELAGAGLPEAVGVAKSDDDGFFAVTIPEAGFWRLTVEAPGSLPVEFDFGRDPLIDSLLLPTLALEPAESVTVEVADGDGAPAAGAWVESRLADPPPRRLSALTWQPLLQPTLTSAAGAVTLELPAGKRVQLRAWRTDHRASEAASVGGSSGRLQLARGRARHLAVRDAEGRPIAGAIVRPGEVERAAGRTDAKGEAVIRDRQALLVLADGRTAAFEMAEDEGGPQAPFEVVVPDASTLAGRVLDAGDRRGVEGAFVALLSPGTRGSEARHARTDARGSFVLTASAGQLEWITTSARGYLETTSRLESDPGESALGDVTLTLEPAVELRGTVIDGEGGPVEGAEVIAVPYTSDMRQLRQVFRLPVRRSASGSQGEFVLPRLPRDAAYAVTAQRAGFAPAERIVADPGAAAEGGGIVISLESGTSITGKLVSPAGAVVAGAEVTLERQEDNAAMRYLASGRAAAGPFVFRGRSDGDGEFAFADVPAGRFRVEIDAPGFAAETLPAFDVEAGMRTHDLGVVTLEEGVELSGQVVDPDGTPLAGVAVEFEEPRSSWTDSWNPGPTPTVEAVTGADGFFTVADRREGEFLDLDLALPGYAPKSLARVEVPRPADFVIVLEPAVTLRGRVVDPEGAPIHQARIEVTREGGGGTFAGRVYNPPVASGESDDRGRFEIADVEPATVRVTAKAEGWLTRDVGSVELVAGEEPEELEIELQPGAALEGRVIAPDGTPHTGAMVRLEDSAGFSRWTMDATDGDGRYRLGGVEPGHHVVVASTEDGMQMSREIEVEPGDNSLDFYLESGVTVSGTVLDSSSQPVEGAAVALSAPNDSSYRSHRLAQSDAAGAFEIGNVSAGLFRLGAEHPEYAATELEQPIEVGGQSVAGLVLRLEDGAELTGALLGAQPKDLVSMEVVAVRQPRSFKQGRVEGDGTYTVGKLASGLWRVMAGSATGLQAEGSIDIGEGERQVRLDIDFGGGLVLTGRILRRGEPLSGAGVRVTGLDSSEAGWGESDYDGRFRLDGLEPGRYTLLVSHFESGTSHAEPIELAADEDVLVEIAGGAVSGRVTFERDGTPLAGAAVILEPRGDSEGPLRAKGAISDDAGNFRLADVSPGEYDLRASKDGYAAQARAIRIDAEAEIGGVAFALSRVEGLTLTLRLASGGVPSTVSYAVLDLSDGILMSGSAPVTSDGRVRLATIPDGHWKILLETAGAATQTLQAHAPRENLAVELQQAARLQVRVEELTQDSSALATLRIRGEDGLPFANLRWGEIEDSWRLYGGEVSLDSLPAGRWILSITTTDERAWQKSVNLRAGVNDMVVFD